MSKRTVTTLLSRVSLFDLHILADEYNVARTRTKKSQIHNLLSIKPEQIGGAWMIDVATGERVLIEDDILRTAPIRQGVYVVFDQSGRARRVRPDSSQGPSSQGPSSQGPWFEKPGGPQTSLIGAHRVPSQGIQYSSLPSSPQILAITSHKNYVPHEILSSYSADYRSASEAYLRQNPGMRYVLRPSREKGIYVITYFSGNEIIHTQFTIENGRFCYIDSRNDQNCSNNINEMIQAILKSSGLSGPRGPPPRIQIPSSLSGLSVPSGPPPRIPVPSSLSGASSRPPPQGLVVFDFDCTLTDKHSVYENCQDSPYRMTIDSNVAFRELINDLIRNNVKYAVASFGEQATILQQMKRIFTKVNPFTIDNVRGNNCVEGGPGLKITMINDLNKWGLLPHQIVLIDDKQENIAAAQQVGFHTINIDSCDGTDFSAHVNEIRDYLKKTGFIKS